jgi:ATP-dependent Lhr-like helicase
VGDKRRALALASTDPANPYGAALPWPERQSDPTAGPAEDAGPAGGIPGRSGAPGHRPGRKAGALVVLVDGELVVYVERGGRTLLTFTDSLDVLTAAATELVGAVRRGALGRLTVERADGESILGRQDPVRQALEAAGFVVTPRGLRLRG